MSYVVLARKWRPQTFADLVGQEHVATTLNNSIALGRVAHAFLFTGVRGVGKTTSARILAKALNCTTGPTATPCLVCPMCDEIGRGVDMDVQEIDAASHTGVDDVRDLQKQLTYQPSRDRFRIYIVDEVHMLSNSAWNAFLKTLEEPPPHVKFIFATTEVGKVPATILSRCQRYDFKLIGAGAIAARLRHVLEAEGIAAEDGAISIVAREAAGSMRDAMSLLDQVIASAGTEGKLSAEAVARVLGVAEATVLSELASALVTGDAVRCLGVVQQLADGGYDVAHVARDLLEHLRNLVVVRVAPDAPHLVDASDAERAALASIVSQSSVEDLTRLHQGFSRALDDVVRSSTPRASLEMALVRLARRPPMVPVDDLLARLAAMESRLAAARGAGSAGGSRMGGDARASAGSPRPRPAGRSGDDPEPGAPFEAWSESAAAPPAQPAYAPPAQPAYAPPAQPAYAPPAQPAYAPPAQPAYAPPAALQERARAPETLPVRPSHDAAPARPSEPPPSGRPGIGRSAQALGASLPVAPSVVLDAKDPRFSRCAQIVEALRAKSARLAPVIELAALVELDASRLAIAIDPRSFEGAQLADERARALVVEAVREVLGPSASLELYGLEVVNKEVPTLAGIRGEELRLRRADADQKVRAHPLVAAAVESLGAEIRDVRLPNDA
jgi:DNA polymerase III subunit gamma/tau